MRQPLYWLLTMMLSPLDLRLDAGGGTGVIDDRARAVLLQLLVDVPDRRSGLSKGGASRLTSRLLPALVETRSHTGCDAWL